MIDLEPFTRLGVLLVRPGMLVLAAPAFGGTFAPALLKVGLTVLFGLAMVPLVAVPQAAGPLGLGVVVFHEAVVGLALGFAIRVLVAGAEFAGQLAGFQVGFSYASLVDPQTGARNNVLGTAYGMMAVLVLLGINGHHDILRALALSYGAVPLGGMGLAPGLDELVARQLAAVFLLALQIASPVMIVLFIVEIALGLAAKAAPMLNLMAQGFPIRVGVGLLVLAASLRVVPMTVEAAVPRVLELGARTAALFR
ncbi:MAG: flagellar biosynthetic protein FliR [Vicinamibacteraceae bacterium]|nr:flagellar biosynthetic protein FliR [Vicinamibacteraceae bacterium]